MSLGLSLGEFNKQRAHRHCIRAVVGAYQSVLDASCVGPSLQRLEQVPDLVQAHSRIALHPLLGDAVERRADSFVGHRT
jgi:hypothetical protein